MIDIIEIQKDFSFVKYYRMKYTFKNYPYLAADKYGNIFMLMHCPNKRTTPFKLLNKSKEYVYYHGYKVYLKRLRKYNYIKLTLINYELNN